MNLFEDNKHLFGRVMLHQLKTYPDDWRLQNGLTLSELCRKQFILFQQLSVGDTWNQCLVGANIANFAMFIYSNTDFNFLHKLPLEEANRVGTRNYLASMNKNSSEESTTSHLSSLIFLFTEYSSLSEENQKLVRINCLCIGSNVYNWISHNLHRHPELSELLLDSHVSDQTHRSTTPAPAGAEQATEVRSPELPTAQGSAETQLR